MHLLLATENEENYKIFLLALQVLTPQAKFAQNKQEQLNTLCRLQETLVMSLLLPPVMMSQEDPHSFLFLSSL